MSVRRYKSECVYVMVCVCVSVKVCMSVYIGKVHRRGRG